jgi:hypothetical protein
LQARANASISVTAAIAPPIIPSIAACHTFFRLGSSENWYLMKSKSAAMPSAATRQRCGCVSTA